MEKSLIQGRRLQYFPASQPMKYFNSLDGTFSAHASICPIRLMKLRGTVDFQRPKRQYPERPKRQYPERPRPVYILFTFTKVLDCIRSQRGMWLLLICHHTTCFLEL